MRILLVEDDIGASRFLKKGLAERGYTVDAVYDGEEGLHFAKSQAYDLLILDIMLPEMNGYEVLKTARRAGVATPAIFLTALDETRDVIHGLELGADDYLVKPFSFPELLARIKAVLRRNQKEADLSRVTIADLTLDIFSRTAERGGEVVELSGKEFKLLEYLMRNAGQILTRTMILENVWGYDFDPSSNIIDVHINKLRNKIDAKASVKLIKTVLGVGYVLRAEEE